MVPRLYQFSQDCLHVQVPAATVIQQPPFLAVSMTTVIINDSGNGLRLVTTLSVCT